MKKINSLFFLMCMCLLSVQAQTKYFTRSGVIKFISDTPMEQLESSNKDVNIILDPATGNIACKVMMKSFEFEKEAMKEHFNDKYLETDAYPNATLSGVVNGVKDYAKNGTYDVIVEGDLTIHGVTKKIKQRGKIIIDSGKIIVKAQFNVKLSDFKIKISSDYVKKISDVIDLYVSGTLTLFQR